MHELKLWRFITDNIKRNTPVILLCVLESKGSSPGRQGFKMAVTANEMVGSIGGGIMEHKFVELAKERLKTNSSDPIIKKQIHSKSAQRDQSGMICSGEQTIFLHRIKSEELNIIEQIINCLVQNKNGELTITSSEILFSDYIIPENDFYFDLKSDHDFEYKEKIGYKNHLYIIGGGHCALAFSRLMNGMDFFIHLFEERKNLNTFLQNDFVHEKKIVDEYSQLKNLIPEGNNIYVVIMTFGYRTDDISVRALSDKMFKYIGVLGSKTKMEVLLSELLGDGVSEEKIKKIHTPIGIHIKSETPEEIAISIAAEIIKVKNSSLTTNVI